MDLKNQTQREIKFRAWDIGKECFIPDCLWAVVTTNFGAFGVMLQDWENYKEGEYFYDNAQTLLQYTGLKDKNGKEIYEGDIMQKWEDCGIEDEPYKKWEASGFEGEWPQKESATIDVCDISTFGYWLKNECFGYEGEDLQSPEEWEIIGNIHENPELITKP